MFVIVGTCVLVSHLLGDTIPEFTGLISIILLTKEYFVFREIKEAEPSWMPGKTEKMFFFFQCGFFRIWLVVGEALGFATFIMTLYNTNGILR